MKTHYTVLELVELWIANEKQKDPQFGDEDED